MIECVDGQFNAHVGVDMLAPVSSSAQARFFGDEREAVIIKPVNEWLDGGVLIVHDHGGVVERPEKMTALLKKIFQLAEVNIQTRRPRDAMQVRPIYEEDRTLIRIEVHSCNLSIYRSGLSELGRAYVSSGD
jgi:hypothetical protein